MTGTDAVGTGRLPSVVVNPERTEAATAFAFATIESISTVVSDEVPPGVLVVAVVDGAVAVVGATELSELEVDAVGVDTLAVGVAAVFGVVAVVAVVDDAVLVLDDAVEFELEAVVVVSELRAAVVVISGFTVFVLVVEVGV